MLLANKNLLKILWNLQVIIKIQIINRIYNFWFKINVDQILILFIFMKMTLKLILEMENQIIIQALNKRITFIKIKSLRFKDKIILQNHCKIIEIIQVL